MQKKKMKYIHRLNNYRTYFCMFCLQYINKVHFNVNTLYWYICDNVNTWPNLSWLKFLDHFCMAWFLGNQMGLFQTSSTCWPGPSTSNKLFSCNQYPLSVNHKSPQISIFLTHRKFFSWIPGLSHPFLGQGPEALWIGENYLHFGNVWKNCTPLICRTKLTFSFNFTGSLKIQCSLSF